MADIMGNGLASLSIPTGGYTPTGRDYSTTEMGYLSSPEFASYAADRGVDLNVLNKDQLTNLGQDWSGNAGANWFGDKGNQAMVGAGLGLGTLGLGLASYLDNKKTADAQRALLKQQYQSNAAEIANKKDYRDALSNMKGLE